MQRLGSTRAEQDAATLGSQQTVISLSLLAEITGLHVFLDFPVSCFQARGERCEGKQCSGRLLLGEVLGMKVEKVLPKAHCTPGLGKPRRGEESDSIAWEVSFPGHGPEWDNVYPSFWSC